jgi:hypothetical protein
MNILRDTLYPKHNIPTLSSQACFYIIMKNSLILSPRALIVLTVATLFKTPSSTSPLRSKANLVMNPYKNSKGIYILPTYNTGI